MKRFLLKAKPNFKRRYNQLLDEVIAEERKKVENLFKDFSFENVKKLVDEKGEFVDIFQRIKEKEATGRRLDEDTDIRVSDEDKYKNRILSIEEEFKELIYGSRSSEMPRKYVIPEVEEHERNAAKLKEEETFWFEKKEKKRPQLPWEKDEKETLEELKRVDESANLQSEIKILKKVSERAEGLMYDVPFKDDVFDPTLEFLIKLENGRETEVAWNQDFVKQLWSIVGGKAIGKTEEFFEQTKFAINEDGIVDRLNLILPGLEREQVVTVLHKILNILKLNKRITTTDVTIQTITDVIARKEEPIHFKWSDRFQTIHPRLEGVEKAFAKILKGKVSAKEMKRVGEIAASINGTDYPFEYDYYYEILKPIFEVKDIVANPPNLRKEYPPKIYGGRSFGKGKRKTSLATSYMEPGTGIIKINGKNHDEYFTNQYHLFNVLRPLHLMNSIKNFDFKIKVKGGGLNSQAQAIRLAMSKSIVAFLPEYGTWFRRNGMLSTDARRVERKKPGLKKARKKTQWVKR